ncbi:MAG: hypothetical protein ACR2MP_03155 [Streptosporangiaceae bacterium]
MCSNGRQAFGPPGWSCHGGSRGSAAVPAAASGRGCVVALGYQTITELMDGTRAGHQHRGLNR